MVDTEGPQMTSQHGAHALHAGLGRLHALTRMHTPTRPDTYMHAHTHACTPRPISNTYCFSTAKIIRERASLLSYSYVACLVTSSVIWSLWWANEYEKQNVSQFQKVSHIKPYEFCPADIRSQANGRTNTTYGSSYQYYKQKILSKSVQRKSN